MFDIFKRDIREGDQIKLYLTTGKEPEGTVIEIGDNHVLLKSVDGKTNRFFDKLIGGWDVLSTSEGTITQTPEYKVSNELSVEYKSYLKLSNNLKHQIDNRISSTPIHPNCKVTAINSDSVLVIDSQSRSLRIPLENIIDKSLLVSIQSNQKLDEIQIYAQTPVSKDYFNTATLAFSPCTVRELLTRLDPLLIEGDFHKALQILMVVKPYLRTFSVFNKLMKELRNKLFVDTSPQARSQNNSEPGDTQNQYKSKESQLNQLISESRLDEALSIIDTELAKNVPDKAISSLLLKRAQIYSAMSRLEDSKLAYQELIKHNESIKAPGNNLSHLYTEVARIQLLLSEDIESVMFSVKESLRYNSQNSYANKLFDTLQLRISQKELGIDDDSSGEAHLLIETFEDNNPISQLIAIDIREHKYNHGEILRNGGIPTAYIAKFILEEAKEKKGLDVSERYPLYLEAAKAFSELNVGSYSIEDYQEAVAYYAILKGMSLYQSFTLKIKAGDLDLSTLVRLKDSANSYYIEALNLLSNISARYLLVLLANYLKLDLAIYYLKNSISIDFDKLFEYAFSDIFKFTIKNRDAQVERMAYKAILDVGSVSIQAWNKMAILPKGTRILMGEFSTKEKKIRIFDILNSIGGFAIDKELGPAQFLRAAFENQKFLISSYQKEFSKLLSIDFAPHNFNDVYNQWKLLKKFKSLLNETELEIYSETEKIIVFLQPFLSRSPKERTSLLLQSRKLVERQIDFIETHTTFFGRTLFFQLFERWKIAIDDLLEQRIQDSLPNLNLFFDPPYFREEGDELFADLVIHNESEITADGFRLDIKFESTEYDEKIEKEYVNEEEIPSSTRAILYLPIPQDLVEDSNAIEVELSIQPKYQGKLLKGKSFSFTLEKEPESFLSLDDIPWNVNNVPVQSLFKGRHELIDLFSRHYISLERNRPYILYGLTRTGKSSILQYLSSNLEGKKIICEGKSRFILPFSWDFSEAASHDKAQDFYGYILFDKVIEQLSKYKEKYNLDLHRFQFNPPMRFKHFKEILANFSLIDVYPVFFIDEFSFIKLLIDKGTIDVSFLHNLRQFSMDSMASFIFSGTYDIKDLIRNPKYGITGQLVNAIEYQVNEISEASSVELIQVIDSKLTFTPEAIDHILTLSGQVPYFIQIICKYCGFYAVENKRRNIGYPELEKVIQILIGKTRPQPNSLISRLPENVFQNNQYSTQESKEVTVLFSSLAYLTKDEINPRPIGFYELEKFWTEKKLVNFKARLADAIRILLEKRILIQEEDEGIPVYRFSVDLFRRWWTVHHPDIDLILTTMLED